MYLTKTKQKISILHESAVETSPTAMLLPWLPWKQICCLFTKFMLISAKHSSAIVCDIFNINLCEVLNKNQFLCPKIQYDSLFINYVASILKLCTILAHLCHVEEVFS